MCAEIILCKNKYVHRRTENFRTDGKISDGRKIFGRTDGKFSDGQTDGRTEKFWTDGRKKFGRTNGRTDGKISDGRTDGRTNKKNRKIQSVSQTIDLVETIRNLAESSKSELSSRGKRPFKV